MYQAICPTVSMRLDHVLWQFVSQHKLSPVRSLKELNGDSGVRCETLRRPCENQSFGRNNLQVSAVWLVFLALLVEHFDHVFTANTKIDGRRGLTHVHSVKPLGHLLRYRQVIEDLLSGSRNRAAND
jgi:hypothetical protein